MARFTKALEQLRTWTTPEIVRLAERYLVDGDPAILKHVGKGRLYLHELKDGMNPPDQFDEQDTRALELIIKDNSLDWMTRWMDDQLETEPPGVDRWGCFVRSVHNLGLSENHVKGFAAKHISRFHRDGLPTSVGRFTLSLSKDDLQDFLQQIDRFNQSTFVEFLLTCGPNRINEEMIIFLVKRGEYIWGGSVADKLVVSLGGKHVNTIYDEWSKRQLASQFSALLNLARYDKDRFSDDLFRAGCAVFDGKGRNYDCESVASTMLEFFGTRATPQIVRYVREVIPGMIQANQYSGGLKADIRQDVFAISRTAFGRGAEEILRAGLTLEYPKMRLRAIHQLIELKAPDLDDLIQGELERLIADKDVAIVREAVKEATAWNAERCAPAIWQLPVHKSKQVRDFAAGLLSRQGEPALKKAKEYLAHKRADVRIAAVQLIAPVESPKAMTMLEEHLEGEEDDDVRDALYAALEEKMAAAGAGISMKDMRRRIARVKDRIKTPPAAWLKKAALPKLHLKDKKALDADAIGYLFYRQSRCKEMKADIEAAPLYRMIDRSRSGDFALALWEGFLKSGADAKDRWTLAMAGLLGDDRLVAPITKQVRLWADSSRCKLAEYAAVTFGLLGTDAALMALDSMAMRYRVKYKNIGKAATEAFAEAAAAKGMSVEELGDRVVPWLGFGEGGPRIIEAGGKKFEARIGMDFKLAFRDTASGKAIKALPASAPAEMRTEFKDMGALLREVVKAQTLRLENLMVRQHRWPLARWQDLFLAHPVLRPFGARMVWGAYTTDGKLSSTFHALEDGALTTLDDQSPNVENAAGIGLVHPLELSPEERTRWAAHLADYEIEALFPQMARPVVLVEKGAEGQRVYKGVSGVSVNGMTFKGRAERMGWTRGSVCDAGGIPFYYKSFPLAATDFLLCLENMYIGIDMYEDITLNEGYFVKTGSVKIGSYTYDEPSDEKDPRIIPFGQVPPIVFSEVMGDLHRIAKKSEPREE
jgi:hypothetical protein